MTITTTQANTFYQMPNTVLGALYTVLCLHPTCSQGTHKDIEAPQTQAIALASQGGRIEAARVWTSTLASALMVQLGLLKPKNPFVMSRMLFWVYYNKVRLLYYRLEMKFPSSEVSDTWYVSPALVVLIISSYIHYLNIYDNCKADTISVLHCLQV